MWKINHLHASREGEYLYHDELTPAPEAELLDTYEGTFSRA